VNNEPQSGEKEQMNEAECRAQLAEFHTASFGWALHCCSNRRTEAEDVLQNTYLKILQGRARFNGRSSFKTWLFSVIRHTAADERRRHWLRNVKMTLFAQEYEHTREHHESHPPMEQEERQHVFQSALARLPRRQREILHLVFYQDVSIQEAAGIIGVSLGSARTHYERGKLRLREWLEPMRLPS
jgi:RNA polymerase sigma factor (sigma-70 family)